jgi:acyl-CoA reductase-like NAD-dependent aldehyde dehydrogenase
MLNLPIIRWGTPYTSLEQEEVVHFATGVPLAKVSQANPGLLSRDLRHAQRARDVLTEIPIPELVGMAKKAGELFSNGTLPIGDGEQSPDQFVKAQSASTGLPEHLCRANMKKNDFVLSNMDKILDALTRGLDPAILSRGYGRESRGVTVSYQAQASALGLVLPSNSPGVHALWLPVIPMQVGLVMKPGTQEPWTPYRMTSAFVQAGVPKEAISIYPGHADIGGEVVRRLDRAMIFGGASTVAQYRGDPRVQVHGPGFSKILLGDDVVDQWEKYLDVMVDSVFSNGGRGCINASGIWASRHTEEIAQAIAERIGPTLALPPEDPQAALAAFAVPGAARAIWKTIAAQLNEPGATHVTAAFGDRLVDMDRIGYIRPTVVHCDSPGLQLANTEFMYPFVSVVKCPQEQMLKKIGGTLVATAITEDSQWKRQLLNAPHIDRLNIGPIPTTRLDWLQPHEGNIVEFLFRPRAFQTLDVA